MIEKTHKSYYEVPRSEIYLIRMANFVKIFLFLSGLSLAKLQRSPGTPDIGHGGESEIQKILSQQYNVCSKLVSRSLASVAYMSTDRCEIALSQFVNNVNASYGFEAKYKLREAKQ